jgi:uncharacterized cupredoxin-like copper-binding protein
MYRRTTMALIAAAAAAVTLAACGSSGGSGKTSSAGKSAAGAAARKPAPTTSAAATPNALKVTAYDDPKMHYAISGAPQAGLVALNFKNAGDDAHEMSLAKLKPGVTLAQFNAALHKPDAEKAANALVENPDGEITGPQIVGPGLSETATVHLDAGHYVIVCFLPGKDGMPHAVMGMTGEVTVGSGPSAATAPKTDATVTLTDSKITLPANFKSGGTFAVSNTGTKAHDFSLARLKGASLMTFFQCVGGSFGKGTPIDTCPGTLVGGITSIPAGQTAYLKISPLPAGSYGYLSTEGDGADVKAGLEGTFTA